MSKPVAFNATGVTAVTAVGSGDVGDLIGYSAGWRRAGANENIPAVYIALEAFEPGDRIPVAKQCILYQPDGLWDDNVPLYLDDSGALTATAPRNSQCVGVAADAYTATIVIPAVAEFVTPDAAAELLLAEMAAVRVGLEVMIGSSLGVAHDAALAEFGPFQLGPLLAEAKTLRVGIETVLGGGL